MDGASRKRDARHRTEHRVATMAKERPRTGEPKAEPTSVGLVPNFFKMYGSSWKRQEAGSTWYIKRRYYVRYNVVSTNEITSKTGGRGQRRTGEENH